MEWHLRVVDVTELSSSVEELLGVVPGEGNVRWNGAQELHDEPQVVWNGDREEGEGGVIRVGIIPRNIYCEFH